MLDSFVIHRCNLRVKPLGIAGPSISEGIDLRIMDAKDYACYAHFGRSVMLWLEHKFNGIHSNGAV